MRSFTGSRDCELPVSALPSLASSWLVPRLPTFVALHPDLEFNLDSSVERVDFADGRFDAALRYGPGSWNGLESELLFEEWLTPVASPSLLEGRPWPRLEQLGEWPLLSPEDAWPRWFELHGGSKPDRFVAHFNDSETTQRATVEGLGISLGRTTLSRPMIESGRLVALVCGAHEVALRALSRLSAALPRTPGIPVVSNMAAGGSRAVQRFARGR